MARKSFSRAVIQKSAGHQPRPWQIPGLRRLHVMDRSISNPRAHFFALPFSLRSPRQYWRR
jgi:hypothetical protein